MRALLRRAFKTGEGANHDSSSAKRMEACSLASAADSGLDDDCSLTPCRRLSAPREEVRVRPPGCLYTDGRRSVARHLRAHAVTSPVCLNCCRGCTGGRQARLCAAAAHMGLDD